MESPNREADLDQRRAETDRLIREQIRILQGSLGKGFVHSPVKYTRYPPQSVRRGARWSYTAVAYMRSWTEFMQGERDLPPAPSHWWPQPRPAEEYLWHPQLRKLTVIEPESGCFGD